MNASTTRQSIRDLYHNAARDAGLAWVGGWGEYSLFEGTVTQWAALDDALAAMTRCASVTAARRRIAHHAGRA